MRIILIIILIIISSLAIYIAIIRRNKFPKLIWTYWHDINNIPLTVTKCIDTWKNNNPDYTITILDDNKIKELCQIDLRKEFPNIDKQNWTDEQKRARYADFARVIIIAKYGGFWMDSSIICTKSLEWIQHICSSAELIGFYAPHTRNTKFPILENWFFAAIPNSQYIKDWLNEIKFMSTFDKESDYVKYIIDLKTIDIQGLEDSLPYLIMHLCATLVQQKNPKLYNIYLMDGLTGPFKYLENAKWQLPYAFEKLCNDKTLQTPLIKIRGTERKYLEEHNIECNNNADANVKYVINK